MGADTFLHQLYEVLSVHPAGLSEYELIKQLEAAGQPGFENGCLRNTLSLFQVHFLLFNALYQLQGHLWEEKRGRLQIDAIRIQLLPYQDSSTSELGEHDPLREYYLDFNNLDNTTEEDVEGLLTQFWNRFIGNDERRDALATLELADPVDWNTIKTQHRRLAMQHHPDRGGNEERLQDINAAMKILAKAYS